jgi:hypothetical protein
VHPGIKSPDAASEEVCNGAHFSLQRPAFRCISAPCNPVSMLIAER